jgi:hypothetical protein
MTLRVGNEKFEHKKKKTRFISHFDSKAVCTEMSCEVMKLAEIGA